jgi:hypothetical protein
LRRIFCDGSSLFVDSGQTALQKLYIKARPFHRIQKYFCAGETTQLSQFLLCNSATRCLKTGLRIQMSLPVKMKQHRRPKKQGCCVHRLLSNCLRSLVHYVWKNSQMYLHKHPIWSSYETLQHSVEWSPWALFGNAISMKISLKLGEQTIIADLTAFEDSRQRSLQVYKSCRFLRVPKSLSNRDLFSLLECFCFIQLQSHKSERYGHTTRFKGWRTPPTKDKEILKPRLEIIFHFFSVQGRPRFGSKNANPEKSKNVFYAKLQKKYSYNVFRVKALHW